MGKDKHAGESHLCTRSESRVTIEHVDYTVDWKTLRQLSISSSFSDQIYVNLKSHLNVPSPLVQWNFYEFWF